MQLFTNDTRVIKELYVPNTIAYEDDCTAIEEGNSIGIVVDTETTGLSPDTSDIFQVGLVVFEYSAEDGKIIQLLDIISDTWEPDSGFTEASSKITGVTMEDVVGKEQKHRKRIKKWFKKCDLVIAHNSGFDRPFLEKEYPVVKKCTFACTQEDVTWNRHAANSMALPFLCFCCGYYYGGHHTALEDAYATFALLHHDVPGEEFNIFQSLLDNVGQDLLLLAAVGSPFSTKDQLREANFRWNPDVKCWCKVITQSEVNDTIGVLSEMYDVERHVPEVTEIDPVDRFTGRMYS